MSSPQPDVAFTLAQQLLGRIMDRLRDAGDPPKRAYVSDGSTVPADECCDGIAWVRVARIIATHGDGTPVSEIPNSSVPTMGASITLEAGILRCVTTPVDGQGRAPSPEEFTADALQAAADRTQLRMAVLCDFPADIIAIDADGQAVGAWVPISVGGCGGGFLTLDVGASATRTL